MLSTQTPNKSTTRPSGETVKAAGKTFFVLIKVMMSVQIQFRWQAEQDLIKHLFYE